MAKKMDKLTRDAIDARKAGMTYGKYMAMKKPTIAEPVPVQEPGVRHICLHCGKEFFETRRLVRKYCSRRCREAFYYAAKKKEAEV